MEYKRSGMHWYFLRLGALGFGGPAALAAYMQRDLVEERGWFTQEEYAEGLALAQLAPGPLAAQLAIYLGWLRGGLLGATAVGFLFILPSFVMVVALGALYVRFGEMWWIRASFYGIGAAVIGIIARRAYRLLKTTLKKDVMRWIVAFVLAISTAITEQEIIWLFLLGGVAIMLTKGIPKPGHVQSWLPPWLYAGLHGPVVGPVLAKLFLYFAVSGSVVFGSGLAIVPFLHGGVVEQYHWLDERQFLDSVAVAMITPGPVVITAAFIGYLVAGFAGAALAGIGVFLPCYLFVVLLAKQFRRWGKNPHVAGFIAGVTAAAVGAIAGSVVVLGRRAISDIPTALIAVVTLGLLCVPKRLPEPLIVLAAGFAGLALYGFGRP